MSSLQVEIGGLCVACQSDERNQITLWHRLYPAFLSEAGAPDLVFQYQARESIELPPPGDLGARLFSISKWAVYRSEQGYLYTSPSAEFAQPASVVMLDSGLRSGTIYGAPSEPLFSPTQPLLQTFAHALAYSGGLVLHAAALGVGGRAWVFAGPSGRGKSHWTQQLRALDPAIQVLTDERVVLREQNGQVLAFGTPWHQNPLTCSPGGLPLERLFFLREAEPDTLRPAGPGESAALLLRSSFLPFYDKDAMQALVQVAGQAASQSAGFLLGYADRQPARSLLAL